MRDKAGLRESKHSISLITGALRWIRCVIKTKSEILYYHSQTFRCYFANNSFEAFSGSEFEPIVRFYLGTGARLGEGLSLTWNDIDFTRGQVIIKGINAKGKRNRVIPLKYSPGLLDMLSNLKRRKDGKVFGPFTKRGKELPQWSEWWVGRHISKVLTSIGLPWATCHTFRHTFASHLVMVGVPLFTVQRLLGHAQIDTTMIYAHLAEDHSAEMMAKLPY